MMIFDDLLQLTQGLLIASTALLGLSGLFVAQLTLGPSEDTIDRLTPKERCLSKWLLLFSLILGTCAILVCLLNLWKCYDGPALYIVATLLVAFQVITFFVIVLILIIHKFNRND